MHEMSLINDLLRKIERVAATHGAARVVSVTVELGALSHLSPAHLREHFLDAAVGTCASGARLEVVENSDITAPNAQDVLLRAVEVDDAP